MSPHAFSVSFIQLKDYITVTVRKKNKNKNILTHVFRSVLTVKFTDEICDIALNSDKPRSLAYH